MMQRLLRNLLPVLLLLAFAALYATYIQRTIQYDEAYSLRHYAVSPDQALLAYTAPNNHLLHSLLLWLSTSLMGTSLVAVRFPALAAGLLALVMAYRLGSRIGGRRSGAMALALLGASITFADYTVNARGYTLAIFLTLVLMMQTLFPPARPPRRWVYGLLVVSMGLVMTLPTMLVAIGGVIVWLLLRFGQSPVYRKMLLPIITGALAGGFFYVPAYLRQYMDPFFQSGGGPDARTGPDGLLLSWLHLSFNTPVVNVLLVAGLVLMIFVMLRRSRYRLVGLWVLCQIAAAVLITVVISSLTGWVIFARNLLYLLGPLVVLASLGLSRIPATGWIIPALLVGVSLSTFQSLGRSNEVDELLARVKQNTTPADVLILGCCSEEQVWYHLQKSGQDAVLDLTPARNRILLVETPLTKVGDLIRNYHLASIIDDCHWLDDGSWSPFSVQACTLKR